MTLLPSYALNTTGIFLSYQHSRAKERPQKWAPMWPRESRKSGEMQIGQLPISELFGTFSMGAKEMSPENI